MNNKNEMNQPELMIINGQIIYMSSNDTIWKFEINSLTVIGEYTYDSFGDDYFLVFITACGDKFEASFYANNRDKFLTKLSLTLGINLECGLCNSVDLNSRIIWPEIIVGKPLYKFVPTKSSSIVKRIKEWIIPTVEIHFSSEVEEFLLKNKKVV